MVKKLPDEDKLTSRIINLAAQYWRYGTPKITAMLHREVSKVNHKREERIWRQQGLKVAKRWINIRIRPEHKDHMELWYYEG